MAKVTMIAGISGSRDGEDWPLAGGTLTCSDVEAAELIGAGLARPLVKVETATVVPVVETARKGLAKGDV